MGNYAPFAPRDLGMQWVPIKQSNYTPDEIVERGYTFTIGNSVIPVSGSFNVDIPAPDTTFDPRVEFMNVYRRGEEDQTGPVQTVTIPVNGVSVTGTTFTNATAAALANPNDGNEMLITPSGGIPAEAALSFDMAPYAAALSGKRILDVSLVYTMNGEPGDIARIEGAIATASLTIQRGNMGRSPVFEGPLFASLQDSIKEYSFGDLNILWGVNAPAPLLVALGAIYPWRSQELALLSPGAPAGTRLVVYLGFPTTLSWTLVAIGYMALKVTFCEEKRLVYGGKLVTPNNPTTYNWGTNLFPLRGTDFTVTGALPAGDYTVTMIHDASPGQPVLNAIRQLYEIPTHPGINVRRTLVPGEQFTTESSQVLPQIALHHSAAVITGSHVYGTQIGAPVYGSVTAIQDVDPDAATGSQYPQVRFYARRFGDTTIPLTLRSVAATGTAVSISVTDFDALPELVDGWREVNLRFSGTIPTFTGPAGTPQAWRWDAVGETAGNQWQVMGADGPSVTGAQSYGPATYFAPFGSTEELTWTNPTIGSSTADVATDAVVIFAQDMPTITGFTLTPSTQTVTGIGLACGAPPRCIPTGISYTRLTWSAVSVPVTGFGQYELERFDALDNEWQQIMNATAPSVTGYNDYESRVGIQSLYRIRACDVLDFCGPWTTGAATLPAPGITGSGNGAGVLIFTSNSNQAGAYNLAYRMQWETGGAQEEFIFPESRSVVLEDMYNKDFPTAFHGTERGGEQFSRALLVQGAAISPESLANFRSLRDMAWADIPYVAVRDELGNRWYATVLVPGGNVRRNRTIYFAQVDIIETTDTAAPVDPS